MKKNIVQEIALERIEILFQEAEKAFPFHPERSNRYIELALKIGKRNKAKIQEKFKEKYCKKCKKFLALGKNSEKIEGKQYNTVKCLNCGKTKIVKK